MPMLRSLRVNARVVATNLFADPSRYVTPVGSFLRETSPDELPQLWSILKGNMRIIRPRLPLLHRSRGARLFDARVV